MRVTDQQMYDNANARLMRTRSTSQEAADRVSSGKRVEHAWDDPSAAGMISRHKQETALQDGLGTAAQRASEELGVLDHTFDQVSTSLMRAQELAVQLSNDTYNAKDRADGGAEVAQLLQAVISQLNVRYGDRYVLGGTADQAPPFDATGAYVGDTNTRSVEIAPGVMQAASIRADQAFRGVGGGTDVIAELQNFATALTTNNVAGIRAAVQSLDDSMQQVSLFRSRAGSTMNVFDLAANTAKLHLDNAVDAQSRLEDIDIFDATTKYSAAERALEATMSASARQFKLTLLDKL